MGESMGESMGSQWEVNGVNGESMDTQTQSDHCHCQV